MLLFSRSFNVGWFHFHGVRGLEVLGEIPWIRKSAPYAEQNTTVAVPSTALQNVIKSLIASRYVGITR